MNPVKALSGSGQVQDATSRNRTFVSMVSLPYIPSRERQRVRVCVKERERDELNCIVQIIY